MNQAQFNSIKRIALLTDGIDPLVTGGMQKHSFYLAKYFAARGNKVDLYHCYHENPPGGDWMGIFTEVERQNIHSVLLPFPRHLRLPGHYLRESKSYSKAILKEFEKRPPVDVVYIQGLSGWSLIRAKKSGKKFPLLIMNPHGLEMFQVPAGFADKMRKSMLQPAFLFNLEHADFVVSLGSNLRNYLEKLGISASKILDLPNAVESSWLVSEPGETGETVRFIFVGRYEYRKGFAELYAALKAISAAVPNTFQVKIVGPIPETARIKLPELSYTGLIRGAEPMQALMDDADILVLPSHSEGLPTVILEAMARGLAVIATDVGAVKDLVSEENGWIIPPRKEKDLEAAMAAALRMPPHQLDIKKEASLRIVKEKFTWEAVVSVTLEQLSKIIS